MCVKLEEDFHGFPFGKSLSQLEMGSLKNIGTHACHMYIIYIYIQYTYIYIYIYRRIK